MRRPLLRHFSFPIIIVEKRKIVKDSSAAAPFFALSEYKKHAFSFFEQERGFALPNRKSTLPHRKSTLPLPDMRCAACGVPPCKKRAFPPARYTVRRLRGSPFRTERARFPCPICGVPPAGFRPSKNKGSSSSEEQKTSRRYGRKAMLPTFNLGGGCRQRASAAHRRPFGRNRQGTPPNFRWRRPRASCRRARRRADTRPLTSSKTDSYSG